MTGQVLGDRSIRDGAPLVNVGPLVALDGGWFRMGCEEPFA